MTVALLTVLGATAFAAWFFGTHERVTREAWTGFQGEARGNDFLAAQLLLEELGIEVESTTTLTPSEWLPPVEDTLVVRMEPTLAVGLESITLEQWVVDGGHLVLLPPFDNTVAVDDFLAGFGFSLEVVANTAGSEEPQEEESDQTAEEDPDGHDVEFHRTYRKILIDDDGTEFAVVRKEDDIVVARRKWGDGYLTLMSSHDAFHNEELEVAGNARLFADVVAGSIEPGIVWLFYQSNFTPLWALILRAAPYLVLGLAMLLVLWMWRVMPVFGPRIRALEESRRSIVEHVKASGIFVWRHDGVDSLVSSATKALIHEGESRHPGLSRHSPARQAEIIARITGMPAQKIMDALSDLGDPSHREFTNSMRKLQIIRKEL